MNQPNPTPQATEVVSRPQSVVEILELRAKFSPNLAQLNAEDLEVRKQNRVAYFGLLFELTGGPAEFFELTGFTEETLNQFLDPEIALNSYFPQFLMEAVEDLLDIYYPLPVQALEAPVVVETPSDIVQVGTLGINKRANSAVIRSDRKEEHLRRAEARKQDLRNKIAEAIREFPDHIIEHYFAEFENDSLNTKDLDRFLELARLLASLQSAHIGIGINYFDCLRIFYYSNQLALNPGFDASRQSLVNAKFNFALSYLINPSNNKPMAERKELIRKNHNNFSWFRNLVKIGVCIDKITGKSINSEIADEIMISEIDIIRQALAYIRFAELEGISVSAITPEYAVVIAAIMRSEYVSTILTREHTKVAYILETFRECKKVKPN
jgi:hypothetical protein